MEWFDLQSFIDCANALGDKIEFCTKKVIQPAMPEYGIKERVDFSCSLVPGVITVKDNQIATSVGLVSSKTIVAYILTSDQLDDPSAISPDDYLAARGTRYQMELIGTTIYGGKAFLYAFNLQPTAKAAEGVALPPNPR